MSSADCSWVYIEQPLSHFERGNNGTYTQRLCVYSNYWKPNQALPIFLYTGNESPVEEYVNNTGLLWDLAAKYNALVVFAEHRYFGESVPDIEGMPNCLTYLTSEEALADYAALCNIMRRKWGGEDSAIIAFGGSYGGMLASWMRMIYPSAIDGAIAASAPILGFPLDGVPIDSSAQTVTYCASPAAGASPQCIPNLKASYVFLSDIGSTSSGRELLSTSLNLCEPLTSATDVSTLLNYLQTPLFDLAEGSYPFPSDYITFALMGTTAELPAWAMVEMCSALDMDYGLTYEGSQEEVKFSVSIGSLRADVDWDVVTNNGYSQEDILASGVLDLLSATTNAIQIWYNVTETLPSCIDWQANSVQRTHLLTPKSVPTSVGAVARSEETICTASKNDMDAMNAWNALTCTDGLNLINWWAQGVGNDLYWPPNQEKGYTMESLVPTSLAYCAYLQGVGLYGLPRKEDTWSFWLDTVYGGTRLQYASNIVFSNGDLDPWYPAGVSQELLDNVQAPDSVVSVVIAQGGHHLDLFWSNDLDPQSVKDVRALEEEHIQRWIAQKSKVNTKKSA